jgi:hypothetical protein
MTAKRNTGRSAEFTLRSLGVGRKIERPESPNQKIDAIKAILNLPEEKYLITLLLPARIKSVFAR